MFRFLKRLVSVETLVTLKAILSSVVVILDFAVPIINKLYETMKQGKAQGGGEAQAA